jgi:DNA-binding transcriptional MerR regulator
MADPYTPTRADDERTLTMLRLRDSGLSLSEIARRCSATKGCVQGRLRRIDRDSAE